MNKYDFVMKKLNEQIIAKKLPGVSLFISLDGKEIYRNHINYKGNEIFRLASMTKPITAVAALKAQELGLINIEDEICKYIDGFKEMKVGKMENGIPVFDHFANKRITIKDILRHQSGLGSSLDVGLYQESHRTLPSTLEEAVNMYKDWYLDFDPATKSSYSGTTALDIVCYIIELTSKMDYYSFLKKYILDPLEMVDTTYKLNDEQKTRLAPMWNMKDEDSNRVMEYTPTTSYEGFLGMVEGYPCGAASLMASLEDYSHFAMMLAGKGIWNGKKILEENSVVKMYTDVINLPCPGVDEVVNWGYTVYVRGKTCDYQPLKPKTFGWSGAYSTHFFVNAEENYSVVMMTNLNNDYGSGSPNIKVLEKAFSEIIKG